MAFAHLHLHTEYSLLDGECRIASLPDAVLAAGQKAVAITDHGCLYGVIDFYRTCVKAGVKPIIGCEIYVAPKSRTDKTYGKTLYHHLVLLCKNETGYKNLTKLCTDAFLNGFYMKPRTDMEMLAKHSEGLIALSGCLSGAVPSAILEDDTKKAAREVQKLKAVFGKDFYIELQRHGLPEQKKVNTALVMLAKKHGVPLVATNDVHYIRREDAAVQKLLMLIQTGKTVKDGGVGFQTDEFYLKSDSEMRALFADLPEALENAEKIAEECRVDFKFGEKHLPVYNTPAGYTAFSYLSKLCAGGFAKMRGKGIIRGSAEVYGERLEKELSIIKNMGFVDYYLIVWDFVNYAKSKGIPVGPGRGSGVSSLAAYFLGITGVDPIANGLLFERFLNPERVSMPDFDIDFCDERRGEVIEYVADKYGTDYVAQIINFGTLACRQAVRDVGRVLGLPYAQVDEVAKLIPRVIGISVADALKESPRLAERYRTDESVRRLIGYARALEGRPRNISQHASGVVVADKPLTEYLPLSLSNGTVVTQFPMNTVADLGLLKIDFLGLRFLTVIEKACEAVREKDPSFSEDTIPFDDAETYKMLSDGNAIGVFQLESEGMRALLTKLSPTCLDDVTTAISLYRPGPARFIDEYLANRRDRARIRYPSPLLAPILDPTYGCMIYQEQVMRVCVSVAGYSYGRADTVRRAMAKKKPDEMQRERRGFVEGALKNGMGATDAEKLFDDIAGFASYAFNKSHAAAYAVLAYRTAYLKRRFPKEYMAALLNSVMGDNDRMRLYRGECRRMGFDIAPPDINESGVGFTVEEKGLRFGLAAVKNVGENFAKHIVSARESGGKYRDFEDFLLRGFQNGSARMTESLIRCGALDAFGRGRSVLLAALDSSADRLRDMRASETAGQVGLFESLGMEESAVRLDYPNVPEYGRNTRLADEKELTGLYFTGHPLAQYAKAARAAKAADTGEMRGKYREGLLKEGQALTLLGILRSRTQKITKNGDAMAFCVLEDMAGETELVVFPKKLSEYGALLREGAVLCVSGRLSVREGFADETEDELKLILDSAYAPTASQTGQAAQKQATQKQAAQKQAAPKQTTSGQTTQKQTVQKQIAQKQAAPEYTKKASGAHETALYIKVTPENECRLNEALRRVREHRGESRVCLYYEKTKKLLSPRGVRVSADGGIVSELKDIMGGENVAVKQRSR